MGSSTCWCSQHRPGDDLWPALQRNRYHGKRQYLFIESICNDPDILAQNYRYKMMYSPDYRTTSEEEVPSLCSCPPEKCGQCAQLFAGRRVWGSYGSCSANWVQRGSASATDVLRVVW